jgi:hypothetical protein
MSFYKFDKNDILLNKIKANPETRIYIDRGSSYFNNSGQAGLKPIPHISGSSLLIDKNSYRGRPLFVAETEYTGSSVTGSFEKDYFLNSSVSASSDYTTAGSSDRKVTALKNTLNHYTTISPAYAFSSSLGDKAQQDLMLVSIPSILYGSSIQEGTVGLKFYITGTLAGELTDSRRNGELIQTSGADAGKVAGVVLYNEGFLLLTGSWSLGPHTETYPGGSDNPRWKYFATQNGSLNNSTFDISFNGVTHTPVMTMFAHANRGELNNSNNPTFVQSSAEKIKSTGSFLYIENDQQQIQNIVSSSFQASGAFEKTTYISSIGIYDEDHNLVGTAKLANPIRKREKDSYTFKLKLDL